MGKWKELAEPFCKTGSQCIGGKCERCAQQEPMACIVKGCSNHRHKGKFVGDLCSPCATFITTGEGKYSQAYRNSQREWQGLTDKEILADEVLRYHFGLHGGAGPVSKKGKAIVEAIEAKLKEKNT